MNFKYLYRALLTTLTLSANLFAAGDSAPELAGFFEGNGGVGAIRTVRLANPNDPTFGGCRLNFGGQIVEFGAVGGEVTLTLPIGYDDQITTYPGTPYLQHDDPMTVKFAKTAGIVRKGYRPYEDSTTTEKASENLAIGLVVVRLDETLPTLEVL
jgi:hypothetical protein